MKMLGSALQTPAKFKHSPVSDSGPVPAPLRAHTEGFINKSCLMAIPCDEQRYNLTGFFSNLSWCSMKLIASVIGYLHTGP